MSKYVIEGTDDNFDAEVLQSDKLVLVDFWAKWCGPCKTIAPLVDELAQEYAEKLKVVKLEVDKNPSTPSKYGVRGIPTLVLFKEGKALVTKVGALTKSELVEFVDRLL